MEKKTLCRDDSLEFLNIFRFLGAFSIALFLHYNNAFLAYMGIETTFADGSVFGFISRKTYVFVEMFFVISGMLFAKVSMKRIGMGLKFDDFLLSKILRLYPLAAITTLVMYVSNLMLYGMTNQLWYCGTLSINELVVDLLFLGEAFFKGGSGLNGPIWYLNILMVCYVFAYFLAKAANKFQIKSVFLVPILLALMIQYSGKSFAAWNGRVAEGFLAFFVGIYLNGFLDYLKKCDSRKRIIIRIALLAEVFGALLLEMIPNGDRIIAHEQNYYSLLVFPEAIALMYDCKWINKICGSGIFKWMGNVSFGIYLWNYPILLITQLLYSGGVLNVDFTSFGARVVMAVTHLIVAGLSYYLIDVKLCKKLSQMLKH